MSQWGFKMKIKITVTMQFKFIIGQMKKSSTLFQCNLGLKKSNKWRKKNSLKISSKLVEIEKESGITNYNHRGKGHLHFRKGTKMQKINVDLKAGVTKIYSQNYLFTIITFHSLKEWRYKGCLYLSKCTKTNTSSFCRWQLYFLQGKNKQVWKVLGDSNHLWKSI